MLALVTVKNTALRYVGAVWWEGQFFLKILISARLYGATFQNIVFGVVTILTELFKEGQKVVVALGRALQQECACGVASGCALLGSYAAYGSCQKC